MPKRKLTDAEIDSHKVTLTIYLTTAANLINKEDWRGALESLKMAIPHANAIGNADYKRKTFSYLNIVRAKVRAANKLIIPANGTAVQASV